ncbi:hypothetical protein ISTM_237 [Insectomime virus]|uniref:Uncharacterized protein n=1 Tax=Tunisvirus fontaine2 TaxID=1421067 RepID=V9SFY2_9VIRU|nr:hypothetical protein D1R32_gp077 [Tunisvirus fontaine2]AHA46135.1 hypothetical protein ISTM_237 [Insectomime virus]AHC54794.1 hypothetical protein TNS_ORF76 [Tunisvirus fontaine2]
MKKYKIFFVMRRRGSFYHRPGRGGFRPTWRAGGWRPYFQRAWVPWQTIYYYPQTAIQDVPDFSQEYYGAVLGGSVIGAGPFTPTIFIGKTRGDVRNVVGRSVSVSSQVFLGTCPATFMFRQSGIAGQYEAYCVTKCCTVNTSADQCKGCTKEGSEVQIPFEQFSSVRGYF